MRIPHLLQMKERGEKWAMLTAYDMYTAEIFDEAGIPVLLVGDSAGNNVYGFETTVPVTVDHLVPLCRAVTTSAKHAMVVADLPFGSYQASPQQALATATRFMKEGMAHAVKLEGGKPMVPEVELLVRAGIPVMGHIGFTPQSEHVLGGYKVQGRGVGADQLIEDALALEEAGCFAIVMEMVPGARSPRRSPRRCASRPSASAPARTATRRCSSGRTWPACAAARRRGSSRSTPTCAASSRMPPARMPRRSPPARSRPTEHSFEA